MRKSSEKRQRNGSKSAGAGPRVNEARDSLSTYRDKRDPGRTNEPFAVESGGTTQRTLQGSYVVHQHAATRMHYDLRIQVGSALKSFAVPKGPSLDPEDKRLAVNTEDHPLEYVEFEDVIPEGNYGAGAMIAWDTGRVSYLEGSAEEGIERGKIDFWLSGFKLNGRFALVQTGARGKKREKDITPEWLLLKKRDAHAREKYDVLAQSPASVLSGLTIDELAHASEVTERIEKEVVSAGAREAPLDASNLTPMLCALEGAKLDDPERLYELKLDGVRILAEKHGERVTLRYRHGRNTTQNYPEIARAVRAMPYTDLLLDGEIVAFDEEGRPSFQRLGPRIQARKPSDVARVREQIPVVYLAFDLLHVSKWSLMDLPLSERKRLLMQVVRGKGYLRALDHIDGDGTRLFELCKQQHLEGVVAKKKSSRYQPGPRRSEDWVKIKTEREDDFVVIGTTPSKKSRGRMGAICVASYRDGQLVLRGKVGTGFDAETLRVLDELFERTQKPQYPCVGEIPPDLAGARFVEPELVVGVQYLGYTDEGRLRHPVFRGVRADVDPTDCTAAPPEELAESAEVDPLPEPEVSSEASRRERVQISNRGKVFWPDEGYTKGDLCDYYAAVSEVMLPFLRDRPVVLVRYPDGIEGKSFYQWRAPPGTPDWIRTLELRDEEDKSERGEKRAFLVDGADALLHIANLGCIPLHVLASREGSRDTCDFLTIDFDIGEQPFKHAVTLALTLKDLLSELGLTGYPKTSGQKGLHVLIPLGEGVDFQSAKLMVELLGRLMVARHTDISTMERRVTKRGPKVYVDTGQTGHSRTIVAPYSVRAVAGATVSTPLSWDEVHIALDPARFTMFTVPGRVAKLGDPMGGLLGERPDIGGTMGVLAKMIG